MKAKLFLVAAVCTASGAGAVENAIPNPFPAGRYERMIQQSPFALATPVVAPVAEGPNFADGWYLTGLAQVDGKSFITFKSHDLAVQRSLFGDEAAEDGLKIQSVDWSPVPRKSTVTIQKGGEMAKLEFSQDPQAGGAPAVPTGQVNGVVRPGAAPLGRLQSPNFPAPNAPGRSGIPRPRGAANQLVPNVNPQLSGQNRPAVVPNQGAAPNYSVVSGQNPPANAAAPSAIPQPGEARRRIRIINNARTP